MGSTRNRLEAIGGGAVFAASVLYFSASYVGRFGSVADPAGGVAAPAMINIALLTAFALHHSVFARPGAKALVARVVPLGLERSAYVWIASGLFALVTALWRPVPGLLWQFDDPLALAFRAAQIAGLVLAVDSGRRVDVGVLSGVRQAFRPGRRETTTLVENGPYAYVRHPLHLALMLLIWPTPVMTGTRLVFALGATAYVLIAIPFEERDLRRSLGDEYGRYAARVRYKLVPGVY